MTHGVVKGTYAEYRFAMTVVRCMYISVSFRYDPSWDKNDCSSEKIICSLKVALNLFVCKLLSIDETVI